MMVKKYRNRYGNQYWFENIGPGEYLFRIEGDSMKWCRCAGRDGQLSINMNDLGMFDPRGGPFVSVGDVWPFGAIKRIKCTEQGFVLEV